MYCEAQSRAKKGDSIMYAIYTKKKGAHGLGKKWDETFQSREEAEKFIEESLAEFEGIYREEMTSEERAEILADEDLLKLPCYKGVDLNKPVYSLCNGGNAIISNEPFSFRDLLRSAGDGDSTDILIVEEEEEDFDLSFEALKNFCFGFHDFNPNFNSELSREEFEKNVKTLCSENAVTKTGETLSSDYLLSGENRVPFAFFAPSQEDLDDLFQLYVAWHDED
jgi:hypothetical protein